MARSRCTAGKRGSGCSAASPQAARVSAVSESSATKTGAGRSNVSRTGRATSPNQPTLAPVHGEAGAATLLEIARAARPAPRAPSPRSPAPARVQRQLRPCPWRRRRPPCSRDPNQARAARMPVSARASHSSSCAGWSPSSSRCGAKMWPTSKTRTSGVWRLALSPAPRAAPACSEGRSTERSWDSGFWSAMRRGRILPPHRARAAPDRRRHR